MKRDKHICIKVINAEHPLRAEVEHYVASRYADAFNARIQTFMPTFAAVYNEHKQLLSVCGYRIASDEPLFLEQYLDYPAEEILTAQFNTPVYRSNLIEFGQLASFSKGMSPVHFLMMAEYLVEQGFEWCIFTATDPLYAIMIHLGLQPSVLADADAKNIEDSESTWGTYYHNHPRVSAGNLKVGLTQLQQRFEGLNNRKKQVKAS